MQILDRLKNQHWHLVLILTAVGETGRLTPSLGALIRSAAFNLCGCMHHHHPMAGCESNPNVDN